jgi:hypothetical protein
MNGIDFIEKIGGGNNLFLLSKYEKLSKPK